MRVGLYSVALVALAALAVGCRGQEYGDYCEKKMSCEGGNDKDKDACVDTAEGDEDVADDYGCGDQFDKVTKCLKDNSVCTSGVYDEGTRCDTEWLAYVTCVDAASSAIQLQP